MMRRFVFVVASLGFVLTGSSSSLAEAPWRVGWWTAANPGLPPLVAGADFPPNNVPDGGFEVAGNAESPTSIAALLYDVPDGSTVGPLVITIDDGAPAAPGTTVQACPLVDANFKTEDGAPMADAPEWDCSDPSLGTADPAGESFSFDVARFVVDEQLAVAIVPAVSAQAVFAPPEDDSLEVRESGRGSISPVSPAPRSTARTAATTPHATGSVALPPLEVTEVEPAVSPQVSSAESTLSEGTGTAVNAVSTRAGGDLGAGSAAVGSLVIVLLGGWVWLRARRALDGVIGPEHLAPAKGE